jgi:single stranded DNA-binding protein
MCGKTCRRSVDCAAFGKTGENIAKYCRKGRPIFVEGRLRFDAWEDKAGAKHNKLSVVVENFQFVSAPDDRTEKKKPQPALMKQEDVPF